MNETLTPLQLPRQHHRGVSRDQCRGRLLLILLLITLFTLHAPRSFAVTNSAGAEVYIAGFEGVNPLGLEICTNGSTSLQVWHHSPTNNPGLLYRFIVEGSDDLRAWTVVSGVITGHHNGCSVFSEPLTTDHPKRFYRVRLLDP